MTTPREWARALHRHQDYATEELVDEIARRAADPERLLWRAADEDGGCTLTLRRKHQPRGEGVYLRPVGYRDTREENDDEDFDAYAAFDSGPWEVVVANEDNHLIEISATGFTDFEAAKAELLKVARKRKEGASQ